MRGVKHGPHMRAVIAREDHAVASGFRRRRWLRHHPSRPPPARITPGMPAPTTGPGTGVKPNSACWLLRAPNGTFTVRTSPLMLAVAPTVLAIGLTVRPKNAVSVN